MADSGIGFGAQAEGLGGVEAAGTAKILEVFLGLLGGQTEGKLNPLNEMKCGRRMMTTIVQCRA